MPFDVRLDNVAIRRFLHDPSGPVAEVIRDRADQVEAAQRRRCPVLTGHLRSTIYRRIDNGPSGPEAEVGATADYALFVEFGTSDTPTVPFIRLSVLAG